MKQGFKWKRVASIALMICVMLTVFGIGAPAEETPEAVEPQQPEVTTSAPEADVPPTADAEQDGEIAAPATEPTAEAEPIVEAEPTAEPTSEPTAQPAPAPKKVIDRAVVVLKEGMSNLKLYAEPDENAAVLDKLADGVELLVLEKHSSWTNVRTTAGVEGYVDTKCIVAKSEYVKPTEAPAEEPVVEPTDEPVVEPTEVPEEEPDMPAVSDEPVVEEPTDEPDMPAVTDEPIVEPTDEPIVVEPTDEPVVVEPTDEPVVVEPTDEPVVVEPTDEPIVEPTDEPIVVEPTAEPTHKPEMPVVSDEPLTTPDPELTKVLGDAEGQPVDIRLDADGLSEIIYSIADGSEVEVIAVEGDWVKVAVDGVIGYIYIDNVPDVEPEQDPDAPEDAKITKVTIFTSRRSVMEPGETVTLTSKIEGNLEGLEIRYQWECDKGAGFEEVPGANEDSYSFPASVETLGYDWRLAVYYR